MNTNFESEISQLKGKFCNIIGQDPKIKKKLEYICLNLDPFKEIDEETKSFLGQIGIFEFNDPYKLTKQLLVLLDEIQN